MGIDIRTYFFNKKSKKPYLKKDKENGILKKDSFYRQDINGTKYYSDILDWLKDKYFISNEENKKIFNNEFKEFIYWEDKSYHVPIIINLKDLINYKSNPYNNETWEENPYLFLWEILRKEYNLWEEDKENILVLIEFI